MSDKTDRIFFPGAQIKVLKLSPDFNGKIVQYKGLEYIDQMIKSREIPKEKRSDENYLRGYSVTMPKEYKALQGEFVFVTHANRGGIQYALYLPEEIKRVNPPMMEDI